MKIIEAARAYLSAGITTIPIMLDGSKAPALRSWRGFITEPPTLAQLDRMFAKAEPCGLAILAGVTSGKLEIIDFDLADRFPMFAELANAIAPGLLDRLPVVKTPNGFHVFLRAPNIEGNQKLARTLEHHGAKKSNVSIETRGEAGYVIAPPSPAEVHPSGVLYVHHAGPAIVDVPTLTAAERDALISIARSLNEVADAPKEERTAAKAKPSKPGEGTKPGEDFDARATWFEILEPHGWEALRTIGDKTYWRRPGKRDGGISATTGHCGSKLYVFSSNAHPFESDRAYNKFTAYGRLNCGGDFATAARELRAKGYGSQPMHRPTPAKWAELGAGLDRIAGGPVEAPLPTDDDAPPDALPLTIDRLESMIADDPGAWATPEVFPRLMAMRSDLAQWARVCDVIRRYKKKSEFNAAIKAFDGKAKRGTHTNGDAWRSQLIYRENSNGQQSLDKCLANVITILQNDHAWRGSVCLDEFSNRLTLRGAVPFARKEGRWSDGDLIEARAWLEREYEIRPSANDVHDAIVAVARRQSFHPLREYFDSITEREEGEGILDTWLIDFFGAPDTPLTRAIGAKWMISAVARAYKPGCKVDTVLILEGKQGLKKSRLLKQLCPEPEWFTDGLSEFGSKDQAVEIEGKWIIELAEMKGFARDLDQIKAFVTREAENYRPPYGRNDVHSPRKCVFAATVNPETAGYLRDSTGNRRYWPIECTKQAPELSPEVRDQLWAEAKRRFLEGEKWWIEDEELLSAAETQQKQRMVIDAWQEPIEHWLADKPEVSMTEIMAECLKIEIGKRNNQDSSRVGKILAVLEWTKYRPSKREGEAQAGYRYKNPRPIFASPPSDVNGFAFV